MNPEIRRDKIFELVKSKKKAVAEDLCRMFDVTGETIRKDLSILNDRGLIIRTHGGAIFREDYDPSLAQRTVSNLKEKTAIARKAAEYVESSDCIILDAGSTIIELAKLLNENSNIVVLSNSLEIINILSKRNGFDVISSGGSLMVKSMSFCGRLAEHSVTIYNIQKAFMSAFGVGFNEGIMETNELEASFKRKAIEAAKEVTVLVDHTKFHKIAHETVCGIKKVNRIITDDRADPEDLKKYEDAGIDVVIAEIR